VTPPAVVLAAGNGLRLGAAIVPKPLVPLAGLPLLDHVVATLVDAGVERVHVVTGHRAEALRAHIFFRRPLQGVVFAHNPRYDEPNGLSLLAAEHGVSEPFLLLMSDHVFAPETLTPLLARPCPSHGGLLVVDRRPERVFDPQDATRVATRGDTIVAIGKGLAEYDAIDTGLFLLSPAVFGAMRESLVAGDASLSGGIRVLAKRGAMKAVDVTGSWIDVDTPEALQEAERLVQVGEIGCVSSALRS
jgi:1L-myo-inositol 1-phosphate cytidylyltransferase